MSREYPPLKRKKQKIKDGREWVVAKYSYIPAIVFFAMAVLCLIDEEVGLFMMPILTLAGLPFLVAAMNCRVTMNTEQVTVRNFFRVSKTYPFEEIESWRMNTHYIYLYLVNGRRICIKREDDVDERLEHLIARVQNNGVFEREGVSDSKLYWGNSSRPIKWTMFVSFLSVFALFFAFCTVGVATDALLQKKENLKSHTFVVDDVRTSEDYVELYDGDDCYDIEYSDLDEQNPVDLVGTKITVLVDEVHNVWELTDENGICWYTFEEYQNHQFGGIWAGLIFILLFGGPAIAVLILLLVAYHAPHKHPRMYEYFETTNIMHRGRVYTFTGLPPQKGNT